MQLKKLLLQSVFWRGAYFVSVLFLNVCVARYFGSDGSAPIYFAVTVFSFVHLFGSLSLESGMGYYASQNLSLVPGMLALGVYWTALVALLSAGLFYLFPSLLPALGNDPKLAFFAGMSFITGGLLAGYVSAIFYARNNFFLPNLIGVLANSLQVIILVVAGSGVIEGFTLDRYLYFYFGVSLIQGVILVISLRNSENTGFSMHLPEKLALTGIFRYALTAYLSNILFMLVYRVDYWFVERFRSAAELGNYIQVSKLSQLLLLVPSFLASAVFPAVASGRREEVLQGLTIISRLSLILIGLPCLVIAALGPFVFPLLFGKTFNLMSLPFLLLVPGILSFSTLYPLSAYYSGKDRVRVNVIGSFLALMFIVIADLIFVPHYGIAAAALVSSLGYMTFHAYVLFTFKREYDISITDFFFIRRSDFLWIKNQLVRLVYRQA
jgi:O-antigen/teichoic acid export membrane protein